MTVLKNEIELNVLNKKYEKEKQKLEDLTDGWISLLRRKKPIKRKEVYCPPLHCVLDQIHVIVRNV